MADDKKKYPPLHPLRLNGPEGAMRKAWEDYDKTHPGFDFLCGPLTRNRDESMEADHCVLSDGWRHYPYGRMTGRDKMVVAEFVQWLGTPCGTAFLRVALDKAGMKLERAKNGG